MTATPTRTGPPVTPTGPASGGEPPDAHQAAGDRTPSLPVSPAFCPACGDQPSEPAAMLEDFEFRTSSDTFLALRCQTCGTVFLSLVPTDGALDQIYPAAYFTSRPSRWHHTAARGTRVLDLGPSVGADRMGRLAHHDAPYDLVRLDLTLECSPDALATLQTVRAALRPGGRAVLLLNNLRSPAFAWFGGRHWGGYDTPRQRRVFTREGLVRLARAAELEVAEVTGLAAGEPWVRSFHRWLTDWNAPAWLAAGFSSRASVSRALFNLVDAMLRPLHRSAFLIATLRRPESATAP